MSHRPGSKFSIPKPSIQDYISSMTPFMIGVAGPSCAGKTTLERHFAEYLGDKLEVLSFDDMFVGMAAVKGAEINDWESPELYRWDDYRRHLQELREGRETMVFTRSRESAELHHPQRMHYPREMLLSAGFLALHDAGVRELFDLKVYVDLPEEEMINRRIARAIAHGNESWLESVQQYARTWLLEGFRKYVLPQRDYADVVLDGTEPPEVRAQKLLDIVV